MIIVTQLRNEKNRVIEWLLYHRDIVGVEKFIIYDDNSNDDTYNLLENMKMDFNISLFKSNMSGNYIQTDNPNIYSSGDLHNRILNSMNSGLSYLRDREEYIDKWCFFIEVDEFIKIDSDLQEYLNSIPDGINRLWIPSYDFEDGFSINNKVLSQSMHRWSDDTRNQHFMGRCKSALRITKDPKFIRCIHNLDWSPCVRTSGTIPNSDNLMIRQDNSGIKLFHYRKPSLYAEFHFEDTSLCDVNLDIEKYIEKYASWL